MARETARCFHTASQKKLFWLEQSHSCHCHRAGEGTQCFSSPGCLPDFKFPHALCVKSTCSPGKVRWDALGWDTEPCWVGSVKTLRSEQGEMPPGEGWAGHHASRESVICLTGKSTTGRGSAWVSPTTDCLRVNGAVQMDQQKLFNNYFPEQFLLCHSFYPRRAADADTSSAAVISGTLQASSGLWWLVSTPHPGLSEAFWLRWGSPTASMQASP